MPGDVVRRLIAGKDTQRGYCRSVKIRAAVQVIGTKKVIPNVAATDLVPVQVHNLNFPLNIDYNFILRQAIIILDIFFVLEIKTRSSCLSRHLDWCHP